MMMPCAYNLDVRQQLDKSLNVDKQNNVTIRASITKITWNVEAQGAGLHATCNAS